MKSLMKLFITSLLVIIFIGTTGSVNAASGPWPHEPDTPKDKPWTVTFNKPVDRTSVTDKSIYVLSASGEKQLTALTFLDGDTKVKIAAPAEGYEYGETYTLHVTEAVRNLDGDVLKSKSTKSFTIVSPEYQVATVAADGTKTVISTYPSFEQASAKLGENQVVLLDGKILQMRDGLVVTKVSSSSAITILYQDEALETVLTYVSPDTELKYVKSSAHSVEVELAGKHFFISMENSSLLPMQTVTNRSHYYVKNGSLYHKLYSHTSKKWIAPYETGKAPAFLKEGENYYSTDGTNFSDAAGSFRGTAHQYFQYLPLLSKTSYTAEELDTYIMKKLLQLERDYPNDSTYKNASKRSKLIGIGTTLKQMESTYHVNALHVLGMAQSESTYGLSKIAQENNNLFGLYVTDENPLNKKFGSVEANVKELMTAFLTKNYLPPYSEYANGTHLGNKALGVNVRYASDPYWGSKIAGHMYRIDRDMGRHELDNKADIRIASAPSLKFRLDPSTSQDYVYHYKKVGMPLTVIDDTLKETPWLKVQSDIAPFEELYTSGDFVEKLKLP